MAVNIADMTPEEQKAQAARTRASLIAALDACLADGPDTPFTFICDAAAATGGQYPGAWKVIGRASMAQLEDMLLAVAEQLDTVGLQSWGSPVDPRH